MTVYALYTLLGKPDHYSWSSASDTAACDWSRLRYADYADTKVWASSDAEVLIQGRRVLLPTCPQCCVMMDLALEMRARWLAEAQIQQ